jgi:hypothetical protein
MSVRVYGWLAGVLLLLLLTACVVQAPAATGDFCRPVWV